MKIQLTVITQYMMKCTPLISDNGRFFFCIKTHAKDCAERTSVRITFSLIVTFFGIIAAFEPFYRCGEL